MERYWTAENFDSDNIPTVGAIYVPVTYIRLQTPLVGCVSGSGHWD